MQNYHQYPNEKIMSAEARERAKAFNDDPENWATVPKVDSDIMSVSDVIRKRIVESGDRFYACDNIAKHIHTEEEKSALVDEVAQNFQGVLDSLLVDTDNDPNSMDTARRMAKMYVYELFEGRYTPEPSVTAFPNTDPVDRYEGILITKAEIKSMCSHHHQPVTGTCYIGLIPSIKVIGLSKYARLAQHLARRGTLQEELTKKIADAIMEHTMSKDVAVIVTASHGCCENRGIMASDSTTTTSVINGQFFNPSVKSEFLSLIGLSKNGFTCN